MTVRILHGDCREVLAALPDESVHCIVTSPPYWGLRDYGADGQIGLEATPAGYIDALVGVFAEARRVLRRDGTLWLNLGDSYAAEAGGRQGKNSKFLDRTAARLGVREQKRSKITGGLKPKDLCGIPWSVALALRADGWWLRSDCIWAKPNPMPESVTDRPTKAHEYVFLLAKSERYFYDAASIAEPNHGYGHGPTPKCAASAGAVLGRADDQHGGLSHGREPSVTTRNARTVWTIATQPFAGAHFATMARDVAERCIKAGCPAGGTVLDPFGGAGTTGLVADRLGRNAILIEINPEYAEMAERRLRGDSPMFADVVRT